jgi:hypothetical protein
VTARAVLLDEQDLQSVCHVRLLLLSGESTVHYRKEDSPKVISQGGDVEGQLSEGTEEVAGRTALLKVKESVPVAH